jgi:hypothetical protein
VLPNLWPYGGLVIALLGALVLHEVDAKRYADLAAARSKEEVLVAQERAAEQAAASKAYEGEVADRLAAEERNADILAKLDDAAGRAAGLQRDRDVARRLLAAACPAGAGPAGGAVPEAPDQRPPHDATPAPSDRPAIDLAGLTAAVLDECRANTDNYAALQRELAPQL